MQFIRLKRLLASSILALTLLPAARPAANTWTVWTAR